jgi:hypothetical protein
MGACFLAQAFADFDAVGGGSIWNAGRAAAADLQHTPAGPDSALMAPAVHDLAELEAKARERIEAGQLVGFLAPLFFLGVLLLPRIRDGEILVVGNGAEIDEAAMVARDDRPGAARILRHDGLARLQADLAGRALVGCRVRHECLRHVLPSRGA